MRLPPYPTYKPSGVEWLGDVPEHWEVDRLKWTTTGTVNGIWGEEPNGVDDLICVRVADFDRERFLVVDEPPTLRAVDETQRSGRMLRKGDLLIEKSGGGEKQLVGCVVYFDHDFSAVCSNFVARMPIVPRYSARFWSYAHAALYAGRLNYSSIKQTTGIQNLDSAAYLDTRVGMPPEPEQRAIAAFLDREIAKIDTLVAKKRTLIERLKEKRTALISRTVTRGLPPDAARAAGLDPHPKLKPSGIDWLGDVPDHWEVRRLKNAGDLYGGAGFPHEYQGVLGEELPFYKVGDLALAADGRTLSEASHSISRATALELRARVIPTGAVVYAKIGAALFLNRRRITPGPCCIDNNMTAFIPRRLRLSSGWAFYWMSTLNFGEFANPGAVPSLSEGYQATLPLLLPRRDEQVAIVDWLDRETAKIDGMVGKVETAIERLQEYRTALITAAVTGKIDVRGAVA